MLRCRPRRSCRPAWCTIAAALLRPTPKSVVCLPSPENVGSRSPGAACATAEKVSPTSVTRRTAPVLPDRAFESPPMSENVTLGPGRAIGSSPLSLGAVDYALGGRSGWLSCDHAETSAPPSLPLGTSPLWCSYRRTSPHIRTHISGRIRACHARADAASHARGRWFEISRAHLEAPANCPVWSLSRGLIRPGNTGVGWLREGPVAPGGGAVDEGPMLCPRRAARGAERADRDLSTGWGICRAAWRSWEHLLALPAHFGDEVVLEQGRRQPSATKLTF